jgi:DinB superfamily
LPHILLFHGGIVIETVLPIIAEPELTTEQIVKAWRHLSATRDLLVESVSRLSSSQWNFKPDTESWSIADNLEHLATIETRVHAVIRNMSNAPEAPSGDRQTDMDELILNEVPKRTTKVKAPIPICPANRWSGTEALQQFVEGRDQTIQLLGAPMLRGRVMPHPLFGPWDGYQWLLATASHTARHLDQIREIKAAPGFPPTCPEVSP